MSEAIIQLQGPLPEFQDFLRSTIRTIINDHIEKAVFSIAKNISERWRFISASALVKNTRKEVHGEDFADCAFLPLACGISDATVFIGIRDKSFSDFFRKFKDALEENLNLACSIKSILIKDPLSGLFNSGYFDECAERLFHEKKLSALAFIDIDKFKTVNEKYGHKLGNALIVSFGSFLKEQLSKDMAAFRYGGDEFAIIFNGLEKTEVMRYLDNLILECAMTEFSCCEYHEKVSISISSGCSFSPDSFKNASAMLSAAEKAMFAAKKDGGGKLFCLPHDKI
ncbi:MAG: hypothetical protein A2020_01475 [Lentisphaerae bacterium GWF2_45_14]|nr:MAG: hypothetical protein A2020_01475 [Lentisphaerae bacterium GWF2_45_14]